MREKLRTHEVVRTNDWTEADLAAERRIERAPLIAGLRISFSGSSCRRVEQMVSLPIRVKHLTLRQAKRGWLTDLERSRHRTRRMHDRIAPKHRIVERALLAHVPLERPVLDPSRLVHLPIRLLPVLDVRLLSEGESDRVSEREELQGDGGAD